ncbi:initiation-control protein YabA [Laceyella sacchari]|uniref:Replication initiation control protein YabA n=1 Tax=Laceyella sacchari TaxID=37482 RepID=A0ABY5U2I5_LACSH|nr:DNA replication initiation control protein YabA [Laceyella sacchari]TCW36558.1 regulator of replication initiation timing [Laceyella sacchari]UWE03743.1 DNA replication initiation control protein YabA [Laceyella sacchari]
MDKEEIFKRVAQMEQQIGEMYKGLGGLKEQIVELIEENTRLVMENQRLKELFVAKEPSLPQQTEKLPPSQKAEVVDESTHKGVNHLSNLYDEGFHICNVHYGRLRGDGDCLFCIAFLNKSSKEK